MPGLPDSARRRWLGALALAGVLPARAAETLAQTYALYPTLAQLVVPAMLDMHAQRFPEAEARLAAASAIVETAPDERWPFRLYVLPPYARAILAQGRADEAVTLLQRAMEAHDRILSEQSPRFVDVVRQTEVGNGLELMRVEYGREIVAAIQTAQVLRSGDELAHEVGMKMTDLMMLVAKAWAAAGRVEALERLYRDRIAPVALDTLDPPRLAAHEYRLHTWAVALAQSGRPALAYSAWQRALHANGLRLGTMMGQASPHSVFAACTQRRVLLSCGLLAAQDGTTPGQETSALVADIIATKGAGARYAETMRAAIDGQDTESAQGLRALEDRIAQLPTRTKDVKPFMRLVTHHDLLAGAAVRALSMMRPGFAMPSGAELKEIQARLGNSVALGFMLVTSWPGGPGSAHGRQYVRYCLSGQEVQLQRIGSQQAIDRQVHACRTELLGGAMHAPAAALLARVLLAGMPRAAGAATEWIVDPDGALHLLPFDVLPDDAGRPLLDTRSIRLVTSLRTLLDPVPGPPPSNPAMIFADPQYGDESAIQSPLRWSAASLGPRKVTPLPDTRSEAQAAAASLRRLGIASRIFAGPEATAQALGSARQPAVLHIAAHAVLRAALDSDAEAEAGSAGEDPVELILPGRQAALLLSREGRPDAVLAKDIGHLGLRGTALVVLSACDTGNGEIAVGEGVASLRRAVELAGARSAVTALWQVPSSSTTSLMTAFYGRLAQGETLASALRGAKLELRARGLAPRAWAGFQLSGANRSLAR